jgi:hypothetical protein
LFTITDDVDATLQNKRFIDAVKRAEVIFGHDLARQGQQVLFYGRALMQGIVETETPRDASVLHVRYDSRTESLEMFVSLINCMKGHCDYMPSSLQDGQNRVPPEYRL